MTVLDDVRADIAALGALTVRDPAPGTAAECAAWDAVGSPVVGVLAVARDALTLDQLIRLGRLRVWRRDVATVVARLRPFLDRAGPRMRLSRHFRDEILRVEDPAPWHARIALSYLDDAPGWAELDWAAVDRYGLRHLAAHLARSGRPTADGIVELVSPGMRAALVAALGREGGQREFAAAAALAAGHAVRELPLAQALPAVVYLGAVGGDTLRTTPDVPPAVAGLMARLGRIDEALSLTAALPPSIQRFQGVLAVLRNCPEERRADVRERAIRAALSVPANRIDAGWTLRDRSVAVGQAAVALAPHDLQRALRLASLSDSSGDHVLRAAGDEALVERIVAGRARAFLDAAELQRTADPALAVDRLVRAEESLSTEDEATRLVCHARLAAHWRRLDAARSRHHVEAARSAAVTVLAGGTDAERTRWLLAVVEAAGFIAPADEDAAHWLLDRFDGMVPDEVTQRPILAAAALWARWGDVTRSEFLLAPLLEEPPGADIALGEQVASAHFAGRIAEVASIVAGFDREVALRLADESFRRVRAAAEAVAAREHALFTMATAFATFAPEAALTAARLLSGRGWVPLTPESDRSRDRASVLAELGMAALEAGRDHDAKTLLEESLYVAGSVSTVDTAALRPEPPSPSRVLQADRRWRDRRAKRLLRSPADALAALVPPPAERGSPYGWDRTLRTLVETAGDATLVDRIADPAERAVALAALGHRDLAIASVELGLPLDGGGPGAPAAGWPGRAGDAALAYLHPDVRVRVDLALRGIDTDAADPVVHSAAAACRPAGWAASAEGIRRHLLDEPLRAAEAAALLGDADLAGEVAAVVRRAADPYTRVLGLARCASVLDALIDEASTGVAALDAADRADALAVLYPVLVTTRPDEAARMLLAAARTRWREAMALLEWAAGPLMRAHGGGLIAALDAAVTRARAFTA